MPCVLPVLTRRNSLVNDVDAASLMDLGLQQESLGLAMRLVP